jgi:hypothetical protein
MVKATTFLLNFIKIYQFHKNLPICSKVISRDRRHGDLIRLTCHVFWKKLTGVTDVVTASTIRAITTSINKTINDLLQLIYYLYEFRCRKDYRATFTFYRRYKLGATEHTAAKPDMFRSNLQGLAEPCQHGTLSPDKLSAGLMLSSLTNQDPHRQTVFLSCALW